MKLKINVLLIIPLLAFSGMLINSQNGNIDGIVALGLVLPPQLGLFFISLKPQIGIAVAIFWLIESWRVGGFRKVLNVFLPIAIACAISFLIFGFWISNGLNGTADNPWNASIWPKGIPVGIFFLAIAVWKREIKFAIAASPFFAPYLAIHSWAFVWLGLLSLVPQYFGISGKQNALVNKMFWRRK